jgi:acetyl esterase/lipase
MKPFLFAFILFSMSSIVYAQQVIPLYDGPVPNSKPAPGYQEKLTERNNRIGITKVITPTLTAYFPTTKNSGTAVVICPGGGYAGLASTHEGSEVAQLLASWGISAFVLKYRLPSDSIMLDKTIGPLQDAQRAIQLVRSRATEWKIDTGKIGIMGFSAGGHLASSAGTHFSKVLVNNPANISVRPDFMILGYPVITFSDKYTHMGSRINLLGKTASGDSISYFSNELQVTSATPPAFLVHAGDDKAVPVENSIAFYKALNQYGSLSELHIYPKGGHGFGLHNATTPDEWSERLKNWLKVIGKL